MLDIRSITRDSLIVLTLMAIGVGILSGVASLIGVIAGGLLGLINLHFITRLVERLVAGVSGGAQMAFGLLFKTFLALVVLLGLMAVLEPMAVLFGMNAVLLAIGYRGIVSLFAAPQEA